MGFFSVLFFVYHLNVFLIEAGGNCPEKFPVEIDGICYKLVTDLMKFKDAKDNCPKLHSSAIMTNDIMQIPEKLAAVITHFISNKISKTNFWIGFKMEDRSMSKAKEDRDWTFDYDDETVVEKDFELWAESPREAGLTCAIINGSNNFDVSAVDCGGARLPVVCTRAKGSACRDGVKPYLPYGDYCIAPISAPLEYNKIHGACHPDKPSPIKSQKMKEYVVNAVLNSFIGSAVYMGIQKLDGVFMYDNGYPVPDSMWGDGEPRDDYDCAGLALQFDGSVKLRTLSCEMLSSSLCYILGDSNVGNSSKFN
ncbi:hypothetical protein JTE90_012868 [Oedothorax gibbosus]|uniref:C-type lectin domain-containing protein n=1 Tax=Oedothorax gibbosus TaxID=931172 RepID=A0AAV6UMS5_9ARAC|nr:hypothetical protein JTE90_012868 [Oedothorax gibbosus]